MQDWKKVKQAEKIILNAKNNQTNAKLFNHENNKDI